MTTPMTPAAKLDELRERSRCGHAIKPSEALALIDVVEASIERDLCRSGCGHCEPENDCYNECMSVVAEAEAEYDAALARLGGGR